MPAYDVQVSLLTEIVDSWLWTVDSKIGLFDVTFDAEAFLQSAGGSIDGAAKGTASIVDAICAHHLWLSFLLEIWQVMVPSYKFLRGIFGAMFVRHVALSREQIFLSTKGWELEIPNCGFR